MREGYFPDKVIEQIPKKSIAHNYECDFLKDYTENIENTKNGRLVIIDGLWVESILEHKSRDPNEGYIILRDLFQESMRF